MSLDIGTLNRVCSFIASQYKEGECPRVDLNTNINEECQRLCQTDYDCSGDLKCCRDSCGMSCQAPMREL
jgi:hypothetical protein